MSSVLNQVIRTCTSCDRWWFTERGGTFDKTGVCTQCREGIWPFPKVTIPDPEPKKKEPKRDPVGPDGEVNPFGVQVGQVWRDLDPRRNRTIRVVSIEGDTAKVMSSGVDGRERVRYVKLERFRPHKGGGYAPDTSAARRRASDP